MKLLVANTLSKSIQELGDITLNLYVINNLLEGDSGLIHKQFGLIRHIIPNWIVCGNPLLIASLVATPFLVILAA